MATPETHPARPRLSPALGSQQDFAALRSLLERSGFSAENVCARRDIASVSEFQSRRIQDPAAQRPADALEAMIVLWMDGEYVETAEAVRLFGAGGFELLERFGLLAREQSRPGLCYGSVGLFPVEGMLLINDRASAPDHSPVTLAPDTVYPAVIDTTARFLRSLPRGRCEAFLDIGTGTGVAGLAASRFARHSWATDIAARSVLFAEFNRRLNGIENATVVEGSLYEPVEGLTFDCIVSHPPYVPARKNAVIFRDGGEDGEQILRAIVEGLPRYLRPGGRFHTLVTAADCKSESFEARLRRWLGEAQSEFDIVVVSYMLTPPRDSMAASLLSRLSPVEDILYWKEMWERRGVEFLVYGTATLRRHAEPRPATTARVQKGNAFTPDLVDWLLAWNAEASGPGSCERLFALRPKISPHTALAVLHRVRDGRFTPDQCALRANQPFDSECGIPSWLVSVVSGCDGTKTWGDRFEEAKRDGVIDAGTEPQAFADCLEPLVTQGLLWLPEWPMPMAPEA